MRIIRLDNRGQISAEYLLLFVVILVIFLFMITYFIGPTIDSSNNITAVSDTKIVLEGIASAVNIVYANGPGSMRTLQVNAPRDMTLTFDSTKHEVKVTVNNLKYSLPDGTPATSKTITAPINYHSNIADLTLTKGWHSVQVYWNNTQSPAVMQVKVVPTP